MKDMDKQIPIATIQTIARSLFKEASKYGFGQLDIIRLVNELMEYCSNQGGEAAEASDTHEQRPLVTSEVSSLPLIADRFIIRPFAADTDVTTLESWLSDKYGRYFVLSSTAAHSVSIEELANGDSNHLGVITTPEGKPIGALAYLSLDVTQKRAELRKLIAEPEFRGTGLAEEATRLWISYGVSALSLEKIYVSTLQTHINNIKLNEKIGFQVEGLLRDEVLIDGVRHDVLRMGFCKN